LQQLPTWYWYVEAKISIAVLIGEKTICPQLVEWLNATAARVNMKTKLHGFSPKNKNLASEERHLQW
jgi:hypothetical protein